MEAPQRRQSLGEDLLELSAVEVSHRPGAVDPLDGEGAELLDPVGELDGALPVTRASKVDREPSDRCGVPPRRAQKFPKLTSSYPER